MMPADATDAFLGRSSAADTIRRLDWSNNPLGPIRHWSQSLRTLAGAVLESAENNGPAVTAPERRGFGSLLIEQVLADDFQGKVDVDYRPQGFHCELTTRLSNLRA